MARVDRWSFLRTPVKLRGARRALRDLVKEVLNGQGAIHGTRGLSPHVLPMSSLLKDLASNKEGPSRKSRLSKAPEFSIRALVYPAALARDGSGHVLLPLIQAGLLERGLSFIHKPLDKLSGGRCGVRRESQALESQSSERQDP